MRLTWIAAAIIAVTGTAHANSGLEQQLSLCAVKTDKLDRLMCFDDLAAKVAHANKNNTAVPVTLPAVVAKTPAATKVPPAPASATAPANVVTEQVAPVANTAAAFGLTQKTAVDEIDKLYFEVAKVNKDPYGALVITLTNGQVWKQNETKRFKLSKGQTIFIEKGAFSSFLLGSDDRNSTTRVKRIK
ncbi:hypothetical protein [Shewanella gaetbuli]|uniref:Uncharacterized protein n=1 Tax=Shewanella gaetbuli TaxID=220752 RepID=A0A9X1ZGZ5_9GAMM|nr:hypothetical protein [Shewanella gaetbuli]MCL1142139.1 hypothetical protein [Shewanella gaetbuli]